MKVAKLVECSLMTRVVVDENATEDEIIASSRARFIDIINTSLGDNIEEIYDDEECPYNEKEELDRKLENLLDKWKKIVYNSKN